MRALILLVIGLLAAPLASANIVFQDDFSDGIADGWTFSGVRSNLWNVNNGELQSTSSQTTYLGDRGFATIDGIADLQHFRLEADVRVVGAVPNRGNDFGHVGFVWGFEGTSAFNTSYLRTHSNHVTSWGLPNIAENFLNLPFNAVNSTRYAMAIEVNYALEEMTVSLAGFSTTFTGADFREVNRQNTGSIGLITWGERVGYDNVVLRDLAQVPAPASALLMLVALGAGLRRRATH